MTCCHCKIANHVIDNKNNPPIILQSIVDNARLAAMCPVLSLPSLRDDTNKYSDFLDTECQMVTVMDVAETERSVFSCHATLCRKSKKRSTGMEEACKHVIAVKTFRGDNEQDIEVEGDPSSTDMPDPKVRNDNTSSQLFPSIRV